MFITRRDTLLGFEKLQAKLAVVPSCNQPCDAPAWLCLVSRAILPLLFEPSLASSALTGISLRTKPTSSIGALFGGVVRACGRAKSF